MSAQTGITAIGATSPVSAAIPVAVLGEPGQESLRRLVALETGKAFQAQVLSRLSNGDFVVGIADTAARMALPEGTRVGEQFSLTMIGREPRPLFMLERPKDQASFSTAARLVSTLMQNAAAPFSALHGAAPLAASSAQVLSAPLEMALKSSLEFSGLFYESHVGLWANGARSLALLQHEPQMRAMHVNPLGKSFELQVHQGSPDAAPAGSAASMELDAGRLVHRQLDTLEQRCVTWQGELFPGQPMQWEVREERHGEAGQPRPTAERVWQSVVRFELPTLGTVAATLQLQGAHLQLKVNASDANSVQALRDGCGELAAALAAAGLPLDLMTVSHEPK